MAKARALLQSKLEQVWRALLSVVPERGRLVFHSCVSLHRGSVVRVGGIFIDIYIYIYIYMCVCLRVCVCVWLRVCMCVCLCVCDVRVFACV